MHRISENLWQQFCVNIATRIKSPAIPFSSKHLVFETARGAFLYDVDGNDYIDFSNGKGSVILGHNDPDVNAAMMHVIRDNLNSVTGPHRMLVELAEQIRADTEPAYRTAFYSNGTDAVMAAVTALRRYTGKRIVLSSGYHGWNSLWDFPGGLFQPNDEGVIDFFFILEKLEELIAEYKDRIACVIISPDVVYLERSFYAEFFKICRIHNLPVIADEVKTGYRYTQGSFLKTLGFEAGIYVYAKCLSNGCRFACICGKQEYLDLLASATYTNYYDLLPFAAALKTLEKMQVNKGREMIAARGDAFLKQFGDFLQETSLPIRIKGNGNLFQLVFGDYKLEADFYSLAAQHGVLFFNGDNQCPSFAFTEDVYNLARSRLETAIHDLALLHRDKIGTIISEEAGFQAAFRQMDGCPRDFSPEKTMLYLQSILNPEKAACGQWE